MTTMLIFLGIVFLAGTSGAPAKYDQQQQGDFNAHIKFENLLFVLALPENTDTLNNLNNLMVNVLSKSVEQPLELKHQLSRSNLPKDQEPIKSGEEIRSEEPYSVEIVRIDENPSARRAESAANVFIGSNKGAEKVAKNMKNFEFPKSREVPTVVGFLLDPSKMHVYKTEDSGRARNVLGNISSPAERARSGTSLKKQLLRKEEEEDVASSSSSADRSDVTPLSAKKEELWLLGHGAENCGPDRHRDASGICQFDESVDDSHLP